MPSAEAPQHRLDAPQHFTHDAVCVVAQRGHEERVQAFLDGAIDTRAALALPRRELAAGAFAPLRRRAPEGTDADIRHADRPRLVEPVARDAADDDAALQLARGPLAILASRPRVGRGMNGALGVRLHDGGTAQQAVVVGLAELRLGAREVAAQLRETLDGDAEVSHPRRPAGPSRSRAWRGARRSPGR